MVQVVWTEEAALGLEAIVDYLQQHDRAAAERIAARLIAAGESLCCFPDRGKPAPGGRRELSFVWPYVIRYRVTPGAVIIERVRHGARRPLA